MGNEWCSPETKQKMRENYSTASKFTSKKYRATKRWTGNKYAAARVRYAP